MWRYLKSHYRKRLYRLERNIVDKEEHVAFVNKIIEEVTPRINVDAVLRANMKYVYSHAALQE